MTDLQDFEEYGWLAGAAYELDQMDEEFERGISFNLPGEKEEFEEVGREHTYLPYSLWGAHQVLEFLRRQDLSLGPLEYEDSIHLSCSNDDPGYVVLEWTYQGLLLIACVEKGYLVLDSLNPDPQPVDGLSIGSLSEVLRAVRRRA